MVGPGAIYPPERRERAVKMVLDHLDEYRSLHGACKAIGPKLGISSESLRSWTNQAQIDTAQRPGATSAEQQRIKSEILRTASIFFGRKLDPRRR